MKMKPFILVLALKIHSICGAVNSAAEKASENSFIVVFDDTGNASDSLEIHQELDNWANQQQLNFQKRRTLVANGIINAITIEMEEKNVSGLAMGPGVKYITPNYLVNLDNTGQVSFELPEGFRYTPHEMTGVDKVHSELKLSGKGIKIGIVDSGIDYTHPGLGGCFGEGCKVAFGTNVTGDEFQSDPIDQCGGHGTHVAGIAAAQDQYFSGVAPEASLGAYKVFRCSRGFQSNTDSATVIQGMIKAYQDDMDVINLSLGGGSQWKEYTTAMVASNIAKKGKIVVASAGNNAAGGLFTLFAPSSGEDVVSVASIDNTNYISKSFKIDTLEDSIFDYPVPKGPPFKFENKELAYVQDATGSYLACQSQLPSLTNKIALVRDGECSVDRKMLSVQLAGGIGMIVIGNGPGLLAVRFDLTRVIIPTIGITEAQGEVLIKELEKGPVKIITHDKFLFSAVPTAYRPSIFSGWGPDPELNLKPDIAAPGGYIFSTEPVPLGAYGVRSGTSMSSPYVAGVAALWLEKMKQSENFAQSEEVARQFLQFLASSAKPVQQITSNDTSPTARQGAGLIQVYDSFMSSVVVSPAKLSLGDSKNGRFYTTTFSIKNTGNQTLDINLDHEVAQSVKGFKDGYTVLSPEFSSQKQWVRFIGPKRIIPPGKESQVKVYVIPNPAIQDDELWLFNGWFVGRTASQETPLFRLPYLGMKGLLSSVNLLPEADSGYPQITNSNFEPLIEGSVVDFSQDDYVNIRYDVKFPTAYVKVEVYDTNNLLLGNVPGTPISWLGSNGDARPIQWKGTYYPESSSFEKTVKSGKYSLTLKLLKPFGNPLKSDDYETWTSVFIECISAN